MARVGENSKPRQDDGNTTRGKKNRDKPRKTYMDNIDEIYFFPVHPTDIF